jgi:hypothetical protein
MTLANIPQGGVITIRVYKTFAGYSWANNYEVQALENLPQSAFVLPTLADRFVALERSVHSSPVVIDRVVISSYAPDSIPYNPDALATYVYGVNGLRSATGDSVPLEICLFVRRITDFGRSGRILYRGCLYEQDVSVSAFRGFIVPSALSSIRSSINSWFQQGLGEQWRLVMASGNPNPTNIRPVSRLEAAERIVVKKINNRYFRRRR